MSVVDCLNCSLCEQVRSVPCACPCEQSQNKLTLSVRGTYEESPSRPGTPCPHALSLDLSHNKKLSPRRLSQTYYSASASPSSSAGASSSTFSGPVETLHFARRTTSPSIIQPLSMHSMTEPAGASSELTDSTVW